MNGSAFKRHSFSDPTFFVFTISIDDRPVYEMGIFRLKNVCQAPFQQIQSIFSINFTTRDQTDFFTLRKHYAFEKFSNNLNVH